MELVLEGLAVVLVLATLVSVWALFPQLLRQQGRLLVRLEAVEELLARSGSGSEVPPSAGMRPRGLSVGTPVPPFRLPDVTGRTIGLEDFRGKRVVLVHWGTSCGYCEQIAPELAELQHQLRKHNTELLFASYGDGEANRRLAEKYGLDGPILLQPQGEPVEAFHGLGTPVAYLLDEDGRVAEPLAIGANEVPELARSAAERRRRLARERPLSESRIEREGLAAGTVAPSFVLPGLDGETVSLDDYRGRRVLLVFSDPECGPCSALAPELGRIDRRDEPDGLAIVMVSRGGTEENRRKAEEHEINFPVLLQPGWQVSKQYGIFETPVAFLIDEEGVIADRVARGSTEILALAQRALCAGKEALVT